MNRPHSRSPPAPVLCAAPVFFVGDGAPGREQVPFPLWLQMLPRSICLTRRAGRPGTKDLYSRSRTQRLRFIVCKVPRLYGISFSAGKRNAWQRKTGRGLKSRPLHPPKISPQRPYRLRLKGFLHRHPLLLRGVCRWVFIRPLVSSPLPVSIIQSRAIEGEISEVSRRTLPARRVGPYKGD